jgi:hypothetical protein
MRIEVPSRSHRLVAAALPLALLAGLASPAFTVVPGDVAPDFALTDVFGGTHALHEARGKVVLVALIGYG